MLNKSKLLFLVVLILGGAICMLGLTHLALKAVVTQEVRPKRGTTPPHRFASNLSQNVVAQTPHTGFPVDFPSITEVQAYQRSFIKPTGSTKSVMVFVDFDDYPAGTLSTSDVADRFIKHDTITRIFHKLSRGQLTIAPFKIINGWRRMPYQSTFWTDGNDVIGPNNPRHYCWEVFKLFPTIDFSVYDIVIIVPSKVREFQRSPTHFLIKLPSGGQIAAVTCGLDIYKYAHPGRILAHEYGHQYGLPDLYRYSNDKFLTNTRSAAVGPWDIMANLYQTNSMLGYNQYVLKWLHKSRVHFIETGTWEGTISPLFAKDGISMVGIADKPLSQGGLTKFYCIEVAPKLDHVTSEEEGLLVYSVDTQTASGHCPIQVYRHETENVYQAPIQAGETLVNGKLPMKVEVIEKIGPGYKVKITIK